MASDLTTQVAASLGISLPPEPITYEDFLAWAPDGIHAEWIDGEVIVLSPASTRHQRLVAFLSGAIGCFVQVRQLGETLISPFQMKTGPDLPGREPDLLFVEQQHRARIQDNHLNGPADLAVEIISPESRARDRQEKFEEYEQGGVREYWLIDPQREQFDAFVLNDAGRYEPHAADADGVYHSRVIKGLALKTEWLWKDPLPPLVQILKEWELV